ncbi:MAG: outer membrane protein transport protein, partial [Candidatus Omnitrophica bacterium]|nr:outer membrane protein transport protein [Candidatus Omnitrophota bacterium]
GKFNRGPYGAASDATFEYDVDGQGTGFNAGLLYELTDEDTLGVFYRSQVRVHLKGTMSTHDLVGSQRALGFRGDASHITSADTDLVLPANVTVGWDHQFNDRFDAELDIGWTGWSAYDTFDTVFGDTTRTLAGFQHLDKDFIDVWSIHGGGTYRINDEWSLLGGYFFQQMAANKNNYTNEIPDGHRHGINLGFEWRQDRWILDFNYMADFLSPVDIENTSGVSNSTDIDGRYHGFIQSITMGLRIEV